MTTTTTTSVTDSIEKSAKNVSSLLAEVLSPRKKPRLMTTSSYQERLPDLCTIDILCQADSIVSDHLCSTRVSATVLPLRHSVVFSLVGMVASYNQPEKEKRCDSTILWLWLELRP
jgi:hypothetical protein